MKKFKKCLLLLLLVSILTACAKFDGTMRVYNDGKIDISGELLIQKDILESENIQPSGIINELDDNLALNIESKEIEKTIDQKVYSGISFKSKQAFQSDSIQIDRNENKITLVINHNLLARLGVELNTLDRSEEGIALLENLGMSLQLKIKMPGTIISANHGKTFMNTVTLDLVDNIDSSFIVVSYCDNTVIYSFIAIALLILASIITLITIVFKRTHHKKHKHH